VLLGAIRDSLKGRGRRMEMETLRKSAAQTFLEQGLEKGRQQGRRSALLAVLTEALERRFAASAEVVARVAAIADSDRLSAILSQAIVESSLEEIDLP
jgi:flagellar biosynthesis/type III secretory pathway protein FliH